MAKPTKPATGKPLLFGDATLDSARIEDIRRLDMAWDRSYVPGYGEQRVQRELDIRAGRKPAEMPRLQWIRIGHVDGREVGDRDMIAWALDGYRFMTKDDLEAYGYDMPPVAYVDAQGRIRRDDLALAFVDYAQWQKNVAKQTREREAFENTPPSHNPEIALEHSSRDRVSLAELGARYVDS